MYSDKTLTLNNGIKISQIQLGTWPINNDDVKKVVRQAISVGYRAFDTDRDYVMRMAQEREFGIPTLNVVTYI